MKGWWGDDDDDDDDDITMLIIIMIATFGDGCNDDWYSHTNA